MKGNKHEWEPIELLPFLDQRRLTQALETVDVREFSPEDGARNEFGHPDVFRTKMTPASSLSLSPSPSPASSTSAYFSSSSEMSTDSKEGDLSSSMHEVTRAFPRMMACNSICCAYTPPQTTPEALRRAFRCD